MIICLKKQGPIKNRPKHKDTNRLQIKEQEKGTLGKH